MTAVATRPPEPAGLRRPPPMVQTPGVSDDGRAWIADLHDRHAAELHRFACRLLGDRGLAEEVVQDTLVRAWRHRDRYEAAQGSTRTWLFAIARNAAIDAARARGVRPALAPSDRGAGSSEEGTAADVDRAIEGWWLEEALRAVSEDHRRVIVEVHVLGRTCAEAAARIGIPEGTVKSRLFHGLRAVRAVLEAAP